MHYYRKMSLGFHGQAIMHDEKGLRIEVGPPEAWSNEGIVACAHPIEFEPAFDGGRTRYYPVKAGSLSEADRRAAKVVR